MATAHPAADSDPAASSARAPDAGLCFLETQFPVSRLSKESYKERKANYSQTLTGLGKWWGRKPLVLVRAVILGLLMPASNDPRKDREVFLALLTMDEEGLWRRKNKNVPLKEVWRRLPPEDRRRWFADESAAERPKLRRGDAKAARERLQRLVFDRMNYDEKLRWCVRPEHVAGPSPAAWRTINAHLGTAAASLPALVRELGRRRFGRAPRVGDAFCGGGSVPFEAARLGCEAYGSDLNPVAALLTWGAINIVGGGPAVAEEVRAAQQAVFEAVDRQVTTWGIEHDAAGWRADAFLYCVETACPECGWRVPLAPSWVIGEKTRTVAALTPEPAARRFAIDIRSGVDREALAAARSAGTVHASRLDCPHCGASTPMAAVRGDQRGGGRGHGLRRWENDDLAPRPGDVFQERLYSVRWRAPGDESPAEYRAVGAADLEREARALALLRERFPAWQARGCVPSRAIAPGDETTRLMRERGWTHWHHLFTPRQLLVHGLLAETAASRLSAEARAACLLGLGRVADWDSRLSRWWTDNAHEKVIQVFSNQALNTLMTFGGRGMRALGDSWFLAPPNTSIRTAGKVRAVDARSVAEMVDVWITDPPYADAINYHELSEFFLAWYEKPLADLFPDGYTDSRRALAVRGAGAAFHRSMVESYRNLAAHMPPDGVQVVMFTHQDAAVWADLALILWGAGLRVTTAWTIATETPFGVKKGNYVQGTVLMVLHRQSSDATAFLDEIVPEVEAEVERQLESMLRLDDHDDPNFSDADYQLAAYAAALRVLTQYRALADLDLARELARARGRRAPNPIERIIADAVRTASNHLVPGGLPGRVWRQLGADEKLYVKGLEVERHGEFRAGVYQEFARGFGVRDYTRLLHTDQANRTRLKTASEFGRADHDGSLVRHALYAVWRAAETGGVSESLTWLHAELPDYWSRRAALAAVLRYLGAVDVDHWREDAAAARLVAGAVENDHV